MIKNYFSLRLVLAGRWLRDSGIHPVFAYIAGGVIFVLLSLRLFHGIMFGEYLYAFAALALASGLSAKSRNDFLKTCFKRNQYRKIRTLENIFIILPFLVILLYKQYFIVSAILFPAALSLSFLNFGMALNFTIPTPFYRYPYEFVVGFRRSFYLIFIVYALVVIAAFVGNYNLGVVALAILFFIVSGYYSNLEDEYYIWIYQLRAKDFLSSKLKRAFINTSFLVIPVAVLLSVFFYHQLIYTLIVLLVGFLFLAGVIISKYSSYPEPLSIVNGILIISGVILPPLLLLLIFYFFSRSANRLKPLLG